MIYNRLIAQYDTVKCEINNQQVYFAANILNNVINGNYIEEKIIKNILIKTDK